MLDRHPVFGFDPDRRSIESPGRVAALVGVTGPLYSGTLRLEQPNAVLAGLVMNTAVWLISNVCIWSQV